MSSTRRPFGSGSFDPSGRSSEAPDPVVLDFLRETYAAPSDPTYWEGLERRVMAAAVGAGVSAEWWQPFAGWVRMGLAAAAIAGVVAAAALVQSRAAEGSAAYAAALDAPAPATPVQAAAVRDGALRDMSRPIRAGSLSNPSAERQMERDQELARERAETFRFVISH